MEHKNQPWFQYLSQEQKHLVNDAFALLDLHKQNDYHLHDYAFIVFPMAIAYEGFLKKFFFELNLISERQYNGDYFRIGKSLNPDLPKRFQDDEWVWDNISELCSTDLANQLWNTWKDCRNRLFHFFPHLSKDHIISISQAQDSINQLQSTMQAALNCDAFLKGNK